MDYCPNFQSAFTTTDNAGKRLAVAGRCKGWGCPYCAPKNRAKWTAVLIDYVNKSDTDWCWFTLTAHKNAHRTSHKGKYTLLNIRRAWGALVKRMRREYGFFEYCRIYEKHQSGAYHLHCIRQGSWGDITRRNRGKKSEYSDSIWLRKNATSLGLGYMTHADNIKKHKAGIIAFYVVKYMTKIETGNSDWEGTRRIQTSRGIKYNLPSEYTWEMHSGLYVKDILVGGKTVYLLNEKRILDSDYFLEHNAWPPDP